MFDPELPSSPRPNSRVCPRSREASVVNSVSGATGGFISAVQVQPKPSRSAGSDWSGRALRRTNRYCATVHLDAGLIFELANPGTVLPGTIGAISLLVALFALNLLPIDCAAAGHVLLGIALMLTEAFIGTFGVLGIGTPIKVVDHDVLAAPIEAPLIKRGSDRLEGQGSK